MKIKSSTSWHGLIVRVVVMGCLLWMTLGCAKVVTNLGTGTETVRFQITLNGALSSGGQLLIPLSPTAVPPDSVRDSNFSAQNPSWYQEGPNEIQQTKLDSFGVSYGNVDTYFNQLFVNWSDYILVTETNIKLVKGNFTTSANSYQVVTTLSDFSAGSNPITFKVNVSDLNGGTSFTNLFYNIYSLQSNGIVKDLLESDPSSILISSTFTRTENDSDTILTTPATGNIQSVFVEVF